MLLVSRPQGYTTREATDCPKEIQSRSQPDEGMDTTPSAQENALVSDSVEYQTARTLSVLWGTWQLQGAVGLL